SSSPRAPASTTTRSSVRRPLASTNTTTWPPSRRALPPAPSEPRRAPRERGPFSSSVGAAERGFGGEHPGDAVDAPAGGRRGRADVERAVGRRVGEGTDGGAGEELAEGLQAAVDVAVDVGRVVLLQGDGPHDAALEYAVAEARGEALDLRLDPLGHVDPRAVGDVAVAPHGVLAGRRARGVGEAG